MMTSPLYSLVRLTGFVLLAVGPITAQPREAPLQDRSRTGEIRGNITIASKQAESHPVHHADPLRERYTIHRVSDDSAMIPMAASEERKLSERAVVYLEGSSLDHGTYPVPEKHPVLNQKNLEFHPQVLPVLLGTTVDFPNRDNLFHNVFSYSQTKEFDLGRYPRNDSRSVTFDKPGIVRVYCDIHSHMNATILVLQNPYFATPANDGSYALHHVPEGNYTLVLWYDRDILERRPIEVKAGGTVDVNFSF